MKGLDCEHPRQKIKALHVPGATLEEEARDVDCAVPDCAAGYAAGEELILVADPPDIFPHPGPQSERQKIRRLKRVLLWTNRWVWIPDPRAVEAAA